MRLGIDFGTTGIVVAFVDRGNYPVVSFETPDGGSCEWFPPLIAFRGSERRYGWEAWAAQEVPGWTVVRSLKRSLEDAGPDTLVQIIERRAPMQEVIHELASALHIHSTSPHTAHELPAGMRGVHGTPNNGQRFLTAEQRIPMQELLRELISALRESLLERSNLPAAAGEPLDVMLGVPANANSNQRFLTAEAFRQAGFNVLGLLNEPSAASIEFGHHKRTSQQFKEKMRILVYDFGGGTFDVSLVELDDREHSVIASEGIPALGGDDFDEVLAGLALETAGVGVAEQADLAQAEWFRLHEECRQKKEALHPNTRRMVVDLSSVRTGWPPVTVAVGDFYDRCRPLVQETLHATQDLLEGRGYGSAAAKSGLPEGEEALEALYVTGGGSELPLVARMLRELFGRRVRRSAYTRAATAIGLAIQADATAGYVLRDQFTRHFGVWREGDAGRVIIFDPLFTRGTPLPGPADPPLVNSRRYFPVHNIGHFRYLECSHLSEEGRPSGDITVWDDIRFPFDPSLQNHLDLSQVSVVHLNHGGQREVEESYSCDQGGAVTVTIANLTDGYNRSYRLGRWSGSEAVVVPGRKRKRKPKK